MKKRTEYDEFVTDMFYKLENTPKELREKVVNGCGPTDNKILAKIIPELVFNRACCIHDFAYFCGGKYKPHKKYSDKLFYQLMKESIYKQTKWLRWFYCGAAWTYVKAVSWFGKKAFEKRERPLYRYEIPAAIEKEISER